VLYLEPCSALSLGGCCCNPPKVEDSVGATCCHSNERAFLKWTGLSPSDMLFASMVADLERLHYYVVADHKKRKMVIAIRGTMSFQDMATDARQNYVPITEDSTLLVPEGFLMCAKRIIREVRANQKLQRFLKSHEDYGVVFTGHSLGASAGTVATILLSLDKSWTRNVECYCLGPSPCVNRDRSQHLPNDEKKAGWKVFSVAFGDDIVPRMCLHSLFRLRSQALASFRRCSDPARNVLSGFRELKEDCDVKRYQTFDFPHVGRHTIDEGKVPPLVIPGRVFHMLGTPKAYPFCPLCCNSCLRWPLSHSSCSPQVAYDAVIYPADVATFSEIRVTANMFTDHFPHRYVNALNSIRIPHV